MIRIEATPVDNPQDYAPMTDVERWRAVDDDGVEIASAGLVTWLGRRWVHFSVEKLRPQQAVVVVRAMRRHLRALNQPLYSPVDAVKYPGARRLDEILGFEPTDEMVGLGPNSGRELEVWRWPASNC